MPPEYQETDMSRFSKSRLGNLPGKSYLKDIFEQGKIKYEKELRQRYTKNGNLDMAELFRKEFKDKPQPGSRPSHNMMVLCIRLNMDKDEIHEFIKEDIRNIGPVRGFDYEKNRVHLNSNYQCYLGIFPIYDYDDNLMVEILGPSPREKKMSSSPERKETHTSPERDETPFMRMRYSLLDPNSMNQNVLFER